MRASFIIGLILAILVTVFALQNNVPTDVKFLMFKSKELPLVLLLLLTLLIGALIAWLFSVSAWYKKRKEISALKKENARLTSQLNDAQGKLLSYTTQKAAPGAPKQDVDDFTKDVDAEM